MSRALRIENATYPLIRVLYADVFGADGAGGTGGWTIATYWNADQPTEVGSETSSNGLYFEECVRQALPGIGDAMLTMDYGIIDGVTVEPLDLRFKHIRIQAARRTRNQTATPAWRTIWVGRCEWQEDALSAGADVPRGRRTYRCVDLLRSYLATYPMDRHAHYDITAALTYGHPGYNYDRDTPNAVAGNKDNSDPGAKFDGPDGTSIYMFNGNKTNGSNVVRAWTDAEIVDNIMLLRRAAKDPIFTLDSAPGLLAGTTPVPVNELDSAWDVLVKLLDRRRGKGMAFFDWDDDVGHPTGALAVKLRVRPQIFSTPTPAYEYPAGTEIQILGADKDASYFVNVDLEGDQRVVDGILKIRSNDDSSVDELTTEGERIEVAVTASGYDNSLTYRWNTALQTAYLAAVSADNDTAIEAIYRPVFQYFGPSQAASQDYYDGDKTGTVKQRADYWTTPLGVLTLADPDLETNDLSYALPMMIELMDDLPIYEGHKLILTGSVGSMVPVATPRIGKPRRMKPIVLVRTTANRFLLTKEYLDSGAQVDFDDDGMWVEWSDDDTTGDRSIRGIYNGVAPRAITEDSLTFTIGLRMPQRVRFATAIASPGVVRRRRTIRIPDLHLWLAHPGAIWDLDRTTENPDGCNAKRAGGTVEGVNGTILRDDRAALARIHYMAWEWYRSDSGRKSATWALRDCGLMATWRDLGGSEIPWPKLGQVVKDMRASGALHTIRTPISRVSYNHRLCQTEWMTDWSEFDYGAA
jgi:hypothetical protein